MDLLITLTQQEIEALKELSKNLNINFNELIKHITGEACLSDTNQACNLEYFREAV